MSDGGPLGELLERIGGRHRWLRTYADEPTDLADALAGHNVTVEHRDRPAGVPGPFVVVQSAEGFRGAVALGSLESFLAGPTEPPVLGDADGERELRELFERTPFASLERRQLLATSREFEERAYRAGEGRLHVAFQTRAAMDAQRATYRAILRETDLDVHVYAPPGPLGELWTDATVHDDVGWAVDRFWVVAYDGGGDDRRACALLAEEHDPDRYFGLWTYDPALVAATIATLEEG